MHDLTVIDYLSALSFKKRIVYNKIKFITAFSLSAYFNSLVHNACLYNGA